jgi:hypothetical protein
MQPLTSRALISLKALAGALDTAASLIAPDAWQQMCNSALVISNLMHQDFQGALLTGTMRNGTCPGNHPWATHQ